MLHHIRGRIAFRHPTHVVVEAGGVGYAVRVPVSTAERLPAAGDVTLYTHLQVLVQQGELRVYGFATMEERDLFEELLEVQGIGPVAALSILSGCALAGVSLADFTGRIAAGDADGLTRIKGVGKKHAERLVVELRKKFEKTHGTAARPDGRVRDAVMALVALGYRTGEAERAVSRALEKGKTALPVDGIVREALKHV
ncbi:MAG: Holliday junction branch migration protein RuvA [Planctomycetota bacterium]